MHVQMVIHAFGGQTTDQAQKIAGTCAFWDKINTWKLKKRVSGTHARIIRTCVPNKKKNT